MTSQSTSYSDGTTDEMMNQSVSDPGLQNSECVSNPHSEPYEVSAQCTVWRDPSTPHYDAGVDENPIQRHDISDPKPQGIEPAPLSDTYEVTEQYCHDPYDTSVILDSQAQTWSVPPVAPIEYRYHDGFYAAPTLGIYHDSPIQPQVDTSTGRPFVAVFPGRPVLSDTALPALNGLIDDKEFRTLINPTHEDEDDLTEIFKIFQCFSVGTTYWPSTNEARHKEY